MSRSKAFFNSFKWRVLKSLIALSLSLGLILASVLIIWFSSLKIPDLSVFEQRKVAQSTKIFDRTGEILLYDIHSDAKRTLIAYEDISQKIKDATIAIEDLEFYSHAGIKPTAILRAVLSNLTPGSGVTQGGSTITQQVIKNSILTTDKTITRKLKEWILALKLEKVLTKDQILNTYLNENPYGGSIYGVEEASKTFFGKSAKNVTLAEAAYIAAIPQAPTFYSPYGPNKDRLDARKNLVLQQMEKAGFITRAEYTTAIKEDVHFLEKNTTGIRAPHFSLYIKDYLVKKYGEAMVEEGGLKVITTLNYGMQEKAEKVISNFAPTLEKSFNASNTAMVAIDPKTGDVLTMVGSRDYFEKGYGNFNIATALRQPGSTFKPFVYATAFMEGYTPDTVLFDVKTEFSSECNPDGTPKNPDDDIKKVCYSPNNYDNLYEGPQSIRVALAHSRNIPAVKTLYLSGISDSIKTAEAMGITTLTEPDRYGLTMVLGGAEVSLLELTSAYGVFANDGVRNPYRTILRIENNKGEILEEAGFNQTQAITVQAARQINDILSDRKVMSASISSAVENLGRPIAVKTGTTNDTRDVWVQGYTPNIVVGAWAGKNDNTPMDKKVAGLIIVPVWGAFMAEINADLAKESFKKPEPTPEDTKPVIRGIWKGGISYKRDTISGKLATDLTPPETTQEVVAPSVHTILHWLDKDDINAPIPENPKEADSQYENWEYGVRNWFEEWKKSNPSFTEDTNISIPTETDDIHVEQNLPKITITLPKQDNVYNTNERINISISNSSKYPIRKSELYINGKFISSNEKNPTNLSFIPQDVAGIEMKSIIKVIVYDTVYNRGEASADITFNVN